MAGLWVGMAGLVAAGRRGRRWPQPLMWSVSLWSLKVRSDRAPRAPGLRWARSPAPPGGGSAAESARRFPGRRRGGFGSSPRPSSLSLRGRAGARQCRRRPPQPLLRGSWRAEGPTESAGLLFRLARRGRLTAIWLMYVHFSCTRSRALRLWLGLELPRVNF